MANIVKVEMELDLDSLKAGLAKGEDEAAKGGKKSGEGFLKGFGGAIAGIAAVVGAAFSVSKIVEEANAADKALLSMNQALNTAGDYSVEASEKFQAFAESIQAATTIEDGQVMSLLALAKTFRVTNDEAEKMTKAAIELSAATGMDLEGALKALGQTTEGTVGRLAKIAPELKDMTPEALKAGAAMDYFIGRFGGTAAAQTQTFAGAMAQATNSFQDILKELGFLITRSPVLIKVVQLLGQSFGDLADYIQSFGKSGQDVLGQFAVKLGQISLTLTQTVIPAFEFLYHVGVTLFKSLQTGLAAIFAGITGIGYAVASLTEKLGLAAEGSAEPFKQMFEAAKETTVQFADEMIATVPELTNQAGSKAAEGFVTGFVSKMGDGTARLKTAASLVGPILHEAVDNSVKDLSWDMFVSSFKGAATDIESKIRDVGKTMYTVMVTGVSNTFAAVGAALVKGEDVFAAFGKAILGMFGDMALQLGSFYLALGVANLFLNPVAAAAQIGGGLALLTIGGALKALAGGGGGGQTTTASPSGGGGGFAQTDNSLQEQEPEFANLSEANEAQEKTSVIVNVQGNILDRRQTGLELADALNDAFGSNGVTVARS